MDTAAQFPPTVDLYQAQSRSDLKVLTISGGWTVRRSFNQMGIYAGERVRVLRKAPFGGPLVIESRGGEVAISKQLAERIRVQVIP